MAGTTPLDSATLRTIIAAVEHRLYELDRRSGSCALCHGADLKAHLGELRVLLREAEARRGIAS